MTPPAPKILRPRTEGAEYLIVIFLPLMVVAVSAGGLCATPRAAVIRSAVSNRFIKPSISRVHAPFIRAPVQWPRMKLLAILFCAGMLSAQRSEERRVG